MVGVRLVLVRDGGLTVAHKFVRNGELDYPEACRSANLSGVEDKTANLGSFILGAAKSRDKAK